MKFETGSILRKQTSDMQTRQIRTWCKGFLIGTTRDRPEVEQTIGLPGTFSRLRVYSVQSSPKQNTCLANIGAVELSSVGIQSDQTLGSILVNAVEYLFFFFFFSISLNGLTFHRPLTSQYR